MEDGQLQEEGIPVVDMFRHLSVLAQLMSITLQVALIILGQHTLLPLNTTNTAVAMQRLHMHKMSRPLLLKFPRDKAVTMHNPTTLRRHITTLLHPL